MKHDLSAQIRVDFEKAFSIRGTAASYVPCMHSLIY